MPVPPDLYPAINGRHYAMDALDAQLNIVGYLRPWFEGNKFKILI